MSTQKFATQALHAGQDVQKNDGTRAVPIYLATFYTRIINPSNDNLQQIIANRTIVTGHI